MPASHLVGKTDKCFHCDIAEIRFVGKLVIMQNVFMNQLIECYLNNTINLRPLAHTSCHVIPTKWR